MSRANLGVIYPAPRHGLLGQGISGGPPPSLRYPLLEHIDMMVLLSVGHGQRVRMEGMVEDGAAYGSSQSGRDSHLDTPTLSMPLEIRFIMLVLTGALGHL